MGGKYFTGREKATSTSKTLSINKSLNYGYH